MQINLQIVWLIAGFAMMLAEFMIPGFVIFFFGLGALCTAGALWISPMAPAGQVLVFIASSLVFFFGVRRFFPDIFKGKEYSVTVGSQTGEFKAN